MIDFNMMQIGSFNDRKCVYEMQRAYWLFIFVIPKFFVEHPQSGTFNNRKK